MDGTRAGRTIGRTLGGILLLAVGACSPPATGGGRPPAERPVPLPKPVEEFASADEFLDFARADSMAWLGLKQPRKCSGEGCEGDRTTRVLLEAPGYVDSLDLQDLPRTGAIVARLHNEGDRTEARYGLAPKGGFLKHRSVDYYYVVQPLPAGTPPSDTIQALLKRVAVTNKVWGLDRDIRIDTIGVRFGACPVRHLQHEKPAHVGFLNCREAGAPGGAVARVALRDEEIDDAWINCLHGCCYMGADQR